MQDRGRRQSPSIPEITTPCVDQQEKVDQTHKCINLSSAVLLNFVVCLHFLAIFGKIAGYRPLLPNSFSGSGAGHWDQTTPALGFEEASGELARVLSFRVLGWKRRLEAVSPPLKPRTKEGSSFQHCSLATAQGRVDAAKQGVTGGCPRRKAPPPAARQRAVSYKGCDRGSVSRRGRTRTADVRCHRH